MSRLVDSYEFTRDFELGERVSFDHEGTRLTGEVVRVYNTREWYHVEVDGQRYEVHGREDDIRRA